MIDMRLLPMNHYLNFTVIGETSRFHVLLPWQNVYFVGFNAIDAHLQSIVPESVFDRTRQLKLSEHQPESNSIDFHTWQRQQKMQNFEAYQQRLSSLVGGVVQKVGISAEGLTYLVIENLDTQQVFHIATERITDSTRIGYLNITEQRPSSEGRNDLFQAP